MRKERNVIRAYIVMVAVATILAGMCAAEVGEEEDAGCTKGAVCRCPHSRAKPGNDAACPRAGTGVGCLIVAHGFDAEWNDAVTKAVAPLISDNDWLYELCFLEDFVRTDRWAFIPPQDAYDRLVERGATQIVVMPLFVHTKSNHVDEVRFVTGLGKLEDPEPALVEARIEETQARIIGITRAIDEHPSIGRKLGHHLLAADDPDLPNHIVLVAHGPTTDPEDEHWNKSLESIMESMVAELPEDFAVTTHVMTLRVHDGKYYHARLDECRAKLREYLEDGEVFLTYAHLRSGYIDAMVMRGLPNSHAFPGVLDDLTPEETSRLRDITVDMCDLGIVPQIVKQRFQEFFHPEKGSLAKAGGKG